MKIWLPRLLIAIVLVFNVQCALVFLISPQSYAAGYELSGVVGEITVRGFGILFLMWNVPYAVAFAHPVRYHVSLLEAVVMQLIGVVGESLLVISLGAMHAMLKSNLIRFIIFDAVGLCLLTGALLFVFSHRRQMGRQTGVSKP